MTRKEPVLVVRSQASRRFVLASIMSGSLFLALLALLHIVRSDLNPGMHFISEYEVGVSGWLMQLAFLAIGTSCITFGIGFLGSLKSFSGILGLLFLFVSASGMVLAGFVPPGATPGLHDLGATLDMVPLAALLISWSLGRDQVWRGRRWLLWLLGLVPLLGFVAYVAGMAAVLPGLKWDPAVGAPVGWQNRLMIVVQAGWLITISGMDLRFRPATSPA